jgi:hypothetical protein
MDRTRETGGHTETIAEMEEVAFIPAWNDATDIAPPAS